MKKLAIIIMVISLLFSFSGCEKKNSSSEQVNQPTEVPTNTPIIQYQELDLYELVSDMSENYARAEAKFVGNYFFYISSASVSSASKIIMGQGKVAVFCSIDDEDLQQTVLDINNGDLITVEGKITKISKETMGIYVYMDVYGIYPITNF